MGQSLAVQGYLVSLLPSPPIVPHHPLVPVTNRKSPHRLPEHCLSSCALPGIAPGDWCEDSGFLEATGVI